MASTLAVLTTLSLLLSIYFLEIVKNIEERRPNVSKTHEIGKKEAKNEKSGYVGSFFNPT